mmetsp:Transcript_8715/g.20991  ORF Transcript_8715/g.20991 Transcript_8715/m.20991 type:complete len:80 (+) Transcript_8715:150-389(+)
MTCLPGAEDKLSMLSWLMPMNGADAIAFARDHGSPEHLAALCDLLPGGERGEELSRQLALKRQAPLTWRRLVGMCRIWI